MNSIKTKLIFKSMVVLSFISLNNTYSQELNIDPRQYVKVLYSKNPNHPKRDTLWIWNSDYTSFLPNQRIKIVDMNGIINVEFDKMSIIDNRNFEGTVSLEAELSGTNGTRKIEVNPYSEVGIQRRRIGIKSEPPSEIIKKLLNMILELRSLSGAYFISRISVEEQNLYNSLIANRERLIVDLGADYDNTKVSAKEFIKSSYAAMYNYRNYDAILAQIDKYPGTSMEDVKNEVETVNAKIDEGSGKAIDQVNLTFNLLNADFNRIYLDEIREFQSLLDDSNYKINLIANYLNSFESGGDDALKAFLVLINKDLINYNSLKNSLLKSQDEMSKIKIEGDTKTRHSIILSSGEDLNKSFLKLKEFTEFRGSILENKIDELIAKNEAELVYVDSLSSFLYMDNKTKLDTENLSWRRNRPYGDTESAIRFEVIEKYNAELSDILSKEAGEIIYKRLVYATMDLGNSGAKSGEVLNLYLTWILDSKNDSIGNSPRLSIGKYFIRETGWKMEIADMFSLVKRINESDFDPANLSPTNFKGAGGAVLMWTFNKEDKGLYVKNKATKRKVGHRNSIINYFEPSLGLNVSYLDFDRTKDVEIGTGMQLGLFKNKVFFGYGANLHLLRPINQSPYFYYIGFSFANLSDLFQNSSSVSSL